MTRDPGRLHPLVRWRWLALRDDAASLGVDLFLTGTLRTDTEQNALYAQGRTKPGPIVTHAPGGWSFHNGLAWSADDGELLALAFDIGGRPPGNPTGYTLDLPWALLGDLAEQHGLVWGGRWKGRKRDAPHFQYTAGLGIEFWRRHRALHTP